MAGDEDDRRFMDPPRGFVVMREDEIDPGYGRPNRWTYRGVINGRSVIRDGLTSHAAACRAAWILVDDLIARGGPIEITNAADADAAVAEALARRHAARRERLVYVTDGMDEWYVVELDSWAAMKAQLLARLLEGAGSVRNLSKAIDVPRSTLGAWIAQAKRDGTWPT